MKHWKKRKYCGIDGAWEYKNIHDPAIRIRYTPWVRDSPVTLEYHGRDVIEFRSVERAKIYAIYDLKRKN